MSKISKKNIIIIGASGHAKVVIDIIEREKKYTIFGLIDSFKTEACNLIGYKILGTEEYLPVLLKKFNIKSGIIAIGDNWTRKIIYDKIMSLVPDFEFVSAIHPNSIIGKNVEIGMGTVIMPGVIINSDSKIGKCCILNTKASLGHDCTINDFSSLAPNSTIGGNVKIGYCCAICLSASVIQDITIENHSVIGACSLVNKDVKHHKMVYGIPAKVIKNIDEEKNYLYTEIK